MSDVEADLLRDILATLKSIEARLTPPAGKPPRNLQLGRVFASGDIIPTDVDLVMADGGLRWVRSGPDEWYPRDVEGPVLSSNELLSRAGHVTEIPKPDSVEGT